MQPASSFDFSGNSAWARMQEMTTLSSTASSAPPTGSALLVDHIAFSVSPSTTVYAPAHNSLTELNMLQQVEPAERTKNLPPHLETYAGAQSNKHYKALLKATAAPLTLQNGGVTEWRAPQASERDASVMARLFPTVLRPTELQRLNQSTEEFAAYWQAHGTGKNTRGSSQIMLGHWRRSSPHVKIIPDTCLEGTMSWLVSNRKVLAKCARTFRQACPYVYDRYAGALDFSQVPQEERYFHPFATIALNVQHRSTKHRDKQLYKQGYVGVLVFGDFESGGGLVEIHSHNKYIDARPGDFYILKAYELEHSVTEWTGTRHSIVFFTDESMFYTATAVSN
ncbi:hypothetical protein QOT17_006035 [Balamuthia mandrillaris]